jgi:hypothetical protein
MKDRTGRQKEDVFGASKKSREENRQENVKGTRKAGRNESRIKRGNKGDAKREPRSQERN